MADPFVTPPGPTFAPVPPAPVAPQAPVPQANPVPQGAPEPRAAEPTTVAPVAPGPVVPEASVPEIPATAKITEVSGGAGSVRVEYADLERIAAYGDDTAVTLAAATARLHTVLVDGDLLASAVLNPGGVAKVQGLLLEALEGSEGLSGLTVLVSERSAQIRLASMRYQAVDALEAAAMQSVDAMLGSMAVPVLGAGVLATGAVLTSPVLAPFAPGLLQEIQEKGPGAAQWLITEHPGIADHVLRGLPSVLLGAPTGGSISPLAASRLLASAYPDPPGYLYRAGQETEHTEPPRDLSDVVERLDFRNTHRDPTEGQLDVQVLKNPDGSVRAAVVDITGTNDWDMTAFNENKVGSITDMPTNFHSLNGDSTSYERMVARALHDSGISSGPGGTPVMLVGHSQGGMVAATAAGHLDYNVTHVVTAGSPVANIQVPEHVQVLSLENNSDVVPHLDATSNPDVANRTTVTFDIPGQPHEVGVAHNIGESYGAAARALDQQPGHSVKGFVSSASNFLNTPADTGITTNRYHASRDADLPYTPAN